MCVVFQLVICCTGLNVNIGDKEGSPAEIRRLNNLKPLLNSSNIMFWRPQKVGSSTILSLLVSFGFRFNYLPRRKGKRAKHHTNIFFYCI